MEMSRVTRLAEDERAEILHVLKQCVLRSRLACASLVNVRRLSKYTILSPRACYPDASVQAPRSRAVLRMARRALRTGEPQAIVYHSASSGDESGHAFTRELVVVVPVSTHCSEPDSLGQVLLVWGSAYGADLGIVGLLRREATQMASQLGGQLSPMLPGDPPLENPLFQRPRLEQIQLPVAPAADTLLHELRVPLAAARYALESLGRMSSRERTRALPALLRTTLLGVAEAQSVLLWFSQIRAIERGAFQNTIVAVSVREVIARALALLPAAADRVRVSVADDVECLKADPLWLTQALTNLFENAVQHGRLSGATLVDARLASQDRVLLTVRNHEEDHDAKHDAIASSTAESGAARRMSLDATRAWDNGAQSDDLTSRGIGLKLVRWMITEMGGDVWVERQQPGEMSVVMSLPVASQRVD